MAYIELDNDQPGIVGLMAWRPESGTLLSSLAQQLLRGDSELTPAERELIAVRVSRGNDCEFCERSHAAAARALMGGDGEGLVEAVLQREPVIEPRMAALLHLADLVRVGGRNVTQADVDAARAAGASDSQVHDAVLIAAAFCMYNRYVDGLGTFAPPDTADYAPMGELLATQGYVR